jgi:flagellar hook-associated protein 1 FlgK
MSLSAAIEIGRSALAASQLGIQIAGNNMANAATPGFSRQVGRFIPMRGSGSMPGMSIGGGVSVRTVQRQVDMALQGRLWGSGSDMAAAQTQQQIFSQIEDTLGELGDHDLSSQLSTFFQSWSEQGNQTPTAASVIQKGDQLAGFIKRLRNDLGDQQRQIDDQIGAGVDRANQLMVQIAGLNQAIASSEAGGAPANALRDQRDSAVGELATLMDITVVDRGQQGVDVLTGSTPIVMGSQTRGLEVRRQVVNGQTQVSIGTVADGTQLNITSGSLGALLSQRTTAVSATISKLDQLASNVIFEVNKLHSTGRNATGLTQSTGTLQIATADRTRALNDPNNQTFSGLPFHAVNGGFVVNVRDRATGTTTSVRVNVDLDGITNAGTPGTTDDTTAADIQGQLNAVPGLSASFTNDGKLQINAAQGFDFSFSDDSSGALAVLGVNAYFTGEDARDIGIRTDLKNDPTLLTTGRDINGQFVENGTSLAIAGLQDAPIAALGGQTLQGLWRGAVQNVGANAAAATTAAQAAAVVFNSLDAQRAAISGVSIDEESINLMDYQRQYQAASKIISVADQLTQELMQLV